MTTTTRPTSLTTEGALTEKARLWIASNGVPSLSLVQSAIDFSAAHGDPLCDDPFRRALIRVAVTEHDARWTR